MIVAKQHGLLKLFVVALVAAMIALVFGYYGISSVLLSVTGAAYYAVSHKEWLTMGPTARIVRAVTLVVLTLAAFVVTGLFLHSIMR
jgi:hypothetical protein